MSADTHSFSKNTNETVSANECTKMKRQDKRRAAKVSAMKRKFTLFAKIGLKCSPTQTL